MVCVFYVHRIEQNEGSIRWLDASWTFLNCVVLCCTLTISRIIPFIVCRKKARQVFNSYLHVLQTFSQKKKGGCSPRFFCAQQKGPLRASLHPLYSLHTQSKRRFSDFPSRSYRSYVGIKYIFKRRDIWQDPRHVNARNLDRMIVHTWYSPKI